MATGIGPCHLCAVSDDELSAPRRAPSWTAAHLVPRRHHARALIPASRALGCERESRLRYSRPHRPRAAEIDLGARWGTLPLRIFLESIRTARAAVREVGAPTWRPRLVTAPRGRHVTPRRPWLADPESVHAADLAPRLQTSRTSRHPCSMSCPDVLRGRRDSPGRSLQGHPLTSDTTTTPPSYRPSPPGWIECRTQSLARCLPARACAHIRLRPVRPTPLGPLGFDTTRTHPGLTSPD